MMRGVIVLITAFMSIIFLKRILYKHHWTALVFIIGGIALVGIAATLFSNGGGGDEEDKHPVIGIILMIAAQFFHGGMYIAEEKFFGDYYMHPIYVVGWEGIWGLCFYTVFLTVVQVIPCSSHMFCPYG